MRKSLIVNDADLLQREEAEDFCFSGSVSFKGLLSKVKIRRFAAPRYHKH